MVCALLLIVFLFAFWVGTHWPRSSSWRVDIWRDQVVCEYEDETIYRFNREDAVPGPSRDGIDWDWPS